MSRCAFFCSSVLLFLLLPRCVSTSDADPTYLRCDYTGEQAVAKCLQPMLDYANELQEETGAMQFPLHGGSIFHKLCSMYQQFMECVEDIHCASLSEDAVIASYGFMCGTGMPLFEQHASCFADNALGEAYLSAMCKAMDGYLRCSHPVIIDKCGPEAWNLVSTVTRDSLRVTMPECDLQKALF